MRQETLTSIKMREEIISMLSSILSNNMILYVKTRKFHWDLAGEGFMDLHSLFQAQYQKLKTSIDELTEKIKYLEFASDAQPHRSHGKGDPAHRSTRGMIMELLADHEAVIAQIGKDVDSCMDKYKDSETSGFLLKLLQEHKNIAVALNQELR